MIAKLFAVCAILLLFMDVIAKGKILNYINAHPASQTAFLVFLKELEYNWQNSTARFKTPANGGLIMSSHNIGRNYVVESQTNTHLNTTLIVWAGHRDEHALYAEEKIRSLHTGEKTKTVSITLTKSGGRVKEHCEELPYSPLPFTEIQPAATPDVYHNIADIDSITDLNYEKVVATATWMFSVKPGVPEFDQLSSLVTQIAQYEAEHIHFPKLALLDLVRLKMEVMGMDISDFTASLGSKQNAALFFSGQKLPAKSYMQKLCKRLRINFPVTDLDY